VTNNVTPRNVVMDALFTVASGAFEFKTFDQRLRPALKVNDFPALFVISAGEDYPPRQIRQLPPKIVIDAQIWIYSNGGKENIDEPPERSLNDALDSIEEALQPNIVTGVQTLDLPERVSHCWIEGRIEKYPGVLDGIAKAIVPVKILLK